MELKVLKLENGHLVSPYQGFIYELDKWHTCKEFDSNPNNDCSNGFYSVEVEGLPYCFRKDNPTHKVFVVENEGKSVIYNQYKRRFERQKITSRELSHQEIYDLALAKEKELGYKLSEVIFPINPFCFEPKIKLSDAIELVKKWASVSDSVRASVSDSVRASVLDSVLDSVWASVSDSVLASVSDSVLASVWDSVLDSVWASVSDSVLASVSDSVRASVWAYISSLFPNIKEWKYIQHIEFINPFQSCIDLWVNGYVPSFDGKIWRLQTKNGIVFEGKI